MLHTGCFYPYRAQIFKLFDTDGKGGISHADLKRVAKELGETLSGECGLFGARRRVTIMGDTPSNRVAFILPSA